MFLEMTVLTNRAERDTAIRCRLAATASQTFRDVTVSLTNKQCKILHCLFRALSQLVDGTEPTKCTELFLSYLDYDIVLNIPYTFC